MSFERWAALPILLAATVTAVTLWLFTRRAGNQMTEATAQARQRHALERQVRAIGMHEEGFEPARGGNRLLAAILRRLEDRDDG
jgi:hypothetical protein